MLPSGSSLITTTFPKCLLRSSFKPLSLSLGTESEAMHPQPSTHLHQRLRSLVTPLPRLYSKRIPNCPLRQLWTRLRMKTSSLAFGLSTPMTSTTAHLPDLPALDSLASSPLLISPLAFATPPMAPWAWAFVAGPAMSITPLLFLHHQAHARYLSFFFTSPPVIHSVF